MRTKCPISANLLLWRGCAVESGSLEVLQNCSAVSFFLSAKIESKFLPFPKVVFQCVCGVARKSKLQPMLLVKPREKNYCSGSGTEGMFAGRKRTWRSSIPFLFLNERTMQFFFCRKQQNSTPRMKISASLHPHHDNKVVTRSAQVPST